jgi:hypothetical protein
MKILMLCLSCLLLVAFVGLGLSFKQSADQLEARLCATGLHPEYCPR